VSILYQTKYHIEVNAFDPKNSFVTKVSISGQVGHFYKSQDPKRQLAKLEGDRAQKIQFIEKQSLSNFVSHTTHSGEEKVWNESPAELLFLAEISRRPIFSRLRMTSISFIKGDSISEKMGATFSFTSLR